VLAIYERNTKYIVKQFSEEERGLWAVLSPDYSRDDAQRLADTLTKDKEEGRAKRNRKTIATTEAQTDPGSAEHEEAAHLVEGPADEQTGA